MLCSTFVPKPQNPLRENRCVREGKGKGGNETNSRDRLADEVEKEQNGESCCVSACWFKLSSAYELMEWKPFGPSGCG